MARLDGKRIVLTGAAAGIGRAFATRLAREGAHVALVDVDGPGVERAAAACREAGVPAIGLHADVSDVTAARAAVHEAARDLGGVDALVNNAAFFSGLRNRPFEEIDVAELDRVLAVNVRGPFVMCQAAVPHLKASGGGRIVNMASGSLLSAPAGLAHYVASKGAVFALTRALARELGKYGITVNSIAPGLTLTDGVRDLYPESFLDTARDMRSLARDETPQDLEGTLVYLLSADSDFVTGQMIVVNGGAQFW